MSNVLEMFLDAFHKDKAIEFGRKVDVYVDEDYREILIVEHKQPLHPVNVIEAIRY